MPLYLKAGTSSLLRVGTSLASNSACCCAGCICTCQPSTVTFTASAVSFYVSCCACSGLVPSGSLYLTIPAMSSVTAYKCCDVSAAGSEFVLYASNPVFLGTFDLLMDGESLCANSKPVSIYAQVSIGSGNCASSTWVAEVRLFGYYGTGACSSVLIPLDRSIDPCDITGINDCLLTCFIPSGISQSNVRTANFCSPTGTYTFTPLAEAVSPVYCGTTASEVNWTLTVA